MFVVISKFTVGDGGAMTTAVRRAFVDRPHLVDSANGFQRMDVLSPLDHPDEIWLITHWTDQSCFKTWHASHQYQDSHSGIPPGLKLISEKTEMLFFEHVAS